MKRLLYVLLLVTFTSLFYSFYQWGVYAYNSSRSTNTLKYYKKEMNEYPKNEQGEIYKTISFLECSIPHWKSNAKKWLFRLLIDIVIFLGVLWLVIRRKYLSIS